MSLTFPLFLVVFLITNIYINSSFIKAQTSTVANTVTITTTTSEDDDDNDYWPNSSQIADLLHTQTMIIANLRSYINALDNKISIIKTKTQEIRGIYDVALNETTGKYFEHPINTFHLTKRMSHDWETLRIFAKRDVTGHILENISQFSEILTFPSAKDLDVIMDKLLKTENVHQIVSSLVKINEDGKFNDINLRTQITWNDCLMLGKHSFKKKDYHLARMWLEAALKRLNKSEEDNVRGNEKILETLVKVEYKSGNMEEACRLNNKILQINSNNTNARKLQEQIMIKIKKH